MSFDPDNVFLRYLRVGDHEVLRGINAPIRPEDWSTVAPQVSNLKVEDGGDLLVNFYVESGTTFSPA